MAGLTSGHNLGFVEKLGLYDSASAYEDLARLDPGSRTLYIDIAGNPKLQNQVHEHFGANLVYDCSVGSAQSLVPPEPDRELAGVRPEFFFAPNWIAKRHKDWGAGEFNKRSGKAGAAFFRYVTEKSLVELPEGSDLEAARKVLVEMIQGRTDPAVGHVIDL